jgi:predicted O-methyltransferase YrrM
MKFTTLAVLGLASTAMAKEMAELMTVETAERNAQRNYGLFKRGHWNKRNKEKCRNGKAGEYACDNVDMMDFLSHGAMAVRYARGMTSG